MLKIGVVGTGHLGKIHLQNLLDLPLDFVLSGFFDSDDSIVTEIEREFQIKSFKELTDIINESEAILIASPTQSHFSIAVESLKAGKHVFIEKPVCFSTEESKKLLRYAQEAGVIVQVGHVERFNPAFLAVSAFIGNPLCVETKRTAPFQKRGTDVSVVYDLMIHDIDIVLKVVNSNVKKIASFGMNILSDNIDYANVHLEFENGGIANLMVSRVSDQRERTAHFFMEDSQVHVDFLNKTAARIQVEISDTSQRQLNNWNIPIESTNAIKSELSSFARSIREGLTPIVSLEDAHRALQIAELITDQIQGVRTLTK